MKNFIFSLLLLFGMATLVHAAGEGVALGQAWKQANDICSTIAKKNEKGLYVWDKDMIAQNGQTASADIATLEATVAALKSDATAKTVTGPNSIKRLKTLLKHAKQALASFGMASPAPVSTPTSK